MFIGPLFSLPRYLTLLYLSCRWPLAGNLAPGDYHVFQSRQGSPFLCASAALASVGGDANSFKMTTCKSLSRQRTLTPFRMNSSGKSGAWGYREGNGIRALAWADGLPSEVKDTSRLFIDDWIFDARLCWACPTHLPVRPIRPAITILRATSSASRAVALAGTPRWRQPCPYLRRNCWRLCIIRVGNRMTASS
jgi:hypothetical protein